MDEARRVHGGADALGVPAHDFSTNRNACGPCPEVWTALREADVAHYPDPLYHALRARLAEWHGVSAERVVVAGSGSEFIHRITAWVARSSPTARVSVPAQAYGDYAQAARAWGLTCETTAAHARLQWHCLPSSPFGHSDAAWIDTTQGRQDVVRVLDLAYEPLRLTGPSPLHNTEGLARVWQLWTPNKALGMTGVRGAYAIAPLGAHEEARALSDLAPSWVLGMHGVVMLQAWTQPTVQDWLARSRQTLQAWKQTQVRSCEALGWRILPSDANYFTAHLPQAHGAALKQFLRTHGIKLRDATSFGLPGAVRVGVLPPASQQVLCEAWHRWEERA